MVHTIDLTFRFMKQHRGQLVEKAIRESGVPLTTVSVKLGKSRRTLYNYFQQTDLSVEVIDRIGKIIHVDFTDILQGSAYKKQLSSVHSKNAEDPAQEYSAEYWKNKYIEVLEQLNSLLYDKMKGKKA